MKKFLVLAVALLSLVQSGCMGYKYASYEPSSDGTVRYHSTNVTLLDSVPSPSELAYANKTTAEAYAIKKNADNQQKLLENALLGKVSTPELGSNILGVVNNNQEKECYFYHPSYPSMRIDVRPRGGFGMADIPSNLKELVIYFPGMNPPKREIKLRKLTKDMVVNGLKLSYYLVVN